MSEPNYLRTRGQQSCNCRRTGGGCPTATLGCLPPVIVGSKIQCESVAVQFRDYEAKPKYISDCEQFDCAGSRADSGVSMSYSSCASVDSLSSILENSHQLPDIAQLRISSCDSGLHSDSIGEPIVVHIASSIHDTGSACKDNVYDSVDEGLGSEVCLSVDSQTSTHVPSSVTANYEECERFQQNEDGDTCLHLAIICGEEAYAVQTIKMATLRESLSIYNNLQQTPLHLAVLTNQPCLVQLLVAWGAVVDARDRHGNTPLHIACSNGLLECSAALTTPVERQSSLEVSLTLPCQQIPQDMNIKNYEGETCLHMAASGHHLEIIHYLTTYAGADINAKEGKSGRTIIHHLAEQPDANLLYKTLRLPGVNVNARTYDGSTPLGLACGRGHSNIEAVLLAAGASMTLAESDSDSEGRDDGMEIFDDFEVRGEPIS